MSYMSRVWMATSVAVAQGGHTEPGHKCKPGLKSIQSNRRRLFSAGDSSDLRPFSGMTGSDIAGAIKNSEVEDTRRQADDSLRKVMYLNCWGQG